MTTADLPAVFEVRASTVENAISIEDLANVHGITPESLAIDMQDKAAGWLCEVDGPMGAWCAMTRCWSTRQLAISNDLGSA